MSKITIDWDMWRYVWGYYFGEVRMLYYEDVYEKITKLRRSPELDILLESIPWAIRKQAWFLWNRPLRYGDYSTPPMAAVRDARSLLESWDEFCAAGYPWCVGTDKYPIHASILMSNWPGVYYSWLAHAERERIEAGRNYVEAQRIIAENRARTLEEFRQAARPGINPYLVSAIYQAGTGNPLQVSAGGPLGAAMMNAVLANGRKPPDAPTGINKLC